jgi:hypothetical protein
MPPPFAANNDPLQYNESFLGDPTDKARSSREKARAARDILMDLPRLQDLPANRQTREAISGGGK